MEGGSEIRWEGVPEELEEKLLDVEVLLASFDERLALRRCAKRALHTSYVIITINGVTVTVVE